MTSPITPTDQLKKHRAAALNQRELLHARMLKLKCELKETTEALAFTTGQLSGIDAALAVVSAANAADNAEAKKEPAPA
jgi:hypothetical protein